MDSISRFVALVAWAFALPAAAQSAILLGTVTAAEGGRPLKGVVVTATAPQLQGKQVAVSDAAGTYGFAGLPPGTYFLQFEREGFETFGHAGVSLGEGRIQRVAMALYPQGSGCLLGVFGELFPLDVNSTSTGMRVGMPHVQLLPLPSR